MSEYTVTAHVGTREVKEPVDHIKGLERCQEEVPLYEGVGYCPSEVGFLTFDRNLQMEGHIHIMSTLEYYSILTDSGTDPINLNDFYVNVKVKDSPHSTLTTPKTLLSRYGKEGPFVYRMYDGNELIEDRIVIYDYDDNSFVIAEIPKPLDENQERFAVASEA